MDARRLRPFRISAAIVLVVIASLLLVPGFRRPILRAAGWALVHEDPIRPADVIVIAVDAYGAGVVEAVDLVHAGIAKGVAVFADELSPADRELARRGVPSERNLDRYDRVLGALGVTTVEHIPGTAVGTESAGAMLVDWCRQHGYRSVVVVSNTEHSRRLGRVFRRSMNGQGVTVLVKPARFSNFDPDRWWETRSGMRTGIVELQKLLLDLARHPLS